MADYDAIVVGSGCAGSVAAYELASAGKDVLLIDRGVRPGTKTMAGGRIYIHSLKDVFPDCEKEAPFERRVTHERISMMGSQSDFTIDFTSSAMSVEGQDSYTVLRSKLDPWLASKAEAAGAKTLFGSPVTSLVKDGSGKVAGVVVDGKEISAEIVVLADGINSLLVHDAVGAPETPNPMAVAVSVKEVISLPKNVISDRCGVTSDDEGTAWLFMGDSTDGLIGGGLMYANKESISLGLVLGVAGAAEQAPTPIYQMLEDFKKHPTVAAMIKGGEVVEYSARMIPEGGYGAMPKLVGDGVMIAGDNAYMCLNIGYQVRGMDFAVAAGMHAGQCAAQALDKGDVSAKGLESYVKALEDSFVLKTFKYYQNTPTFMGKHPEIFSKYPDAIGEMMNSMFIVNDEVTPPLIDSVEDMTKKIGLFQLLKDAKGAMRAL